MRIPPRVLAVDDEPLMRMTVLHRLRELGYEVETASSVEDAMDRLDRQPFDLLLTDFEIEDGDGLDLSRYARTVQQGIKVIILTGSPERFDEDAALRAGVDAILHKPCPLSAIAERADAVMQGLRGPGGPRSQRS